MYRKAHENMVRRSLLVENLVSFERPALLPLLATYQNEALVARKLLDSNLIKLNLDAEILEVGGGILSLTVQLASEGFRVTTVEPVADGFSNIAYLMNVYLRIAKEEKIKFNFNDSFIENTQFENKFDFIFSINVMEHLEDPYSITVHLMKFLKNSGKLRFYCPNYDFPYEPHFQKWLVYRRNKAFYLPLSRAKSRFINPSERVNVHRSLNFLTVAKLEKFFSKANISHTLNNDALRDLLKRVEFDVQLQNRHRLITFVVKFLVKFRMIGLVNLLPKRFWPIIDIEISH